MKMLNVPRFCAVLVALNGTVNILSAWLVYYPAGIALLKEILPVKWVPRKKKSKIL